MSCFVWRISTVSSSEDGFSNLVMNTKDIYDIFVGLYHVWKKSASVLVNTEHEVQTGTKIPKPSMLNLRSVNKIHGLSQSAISSTIPV